jgi:DNA polymerase III epsilon subunit-like protein
MILFFDTETTGLPKDYKAPASDSQSWPRLVQIAWILTDTTGGQVETFEAIVKPSGFRIPEEATKLHGISTDQALQEGMELAKALLRFTQLLRQSDPKVKLVVGHNISFDKKILQAEFCRLGWPDFLADRDTVCTMQKSTQHCKLPKANGQNGYKWPKLQELHKKLFDSEFSEAHNAGSDIQATARCFFELRRLKVIE